MNTDFKTLILGGITQLFPTFIDIMMNSRSKEETSKFPEPPNIKNYLKDIDISAILDEVRATPQNKLLHHQMHAHSTASAAQRAADLIVDYQHRIGYRAYNYTDPEQKANLRALTLEELSPILLQSGIGGSH